MAITPDTKDWTWVLRTQCPECGLDAGSVPFTSVPEMIRLNGAAWQPVLARPDVASRPAPDVWSPLEYGCHVRDVLALFQRRLTLILTQDDPTFPNWDQDATAVEDRYGEQDSALVAEELAANAESLARVFESVAEDQWPRTGNRSDGATFDVASLARYCVHDIVHHMHDVSKV